jgi:outer membrane PBP1 activator LpoA protein
MQKINNPSLARFLVLWIICLLAASCSFAPKSIDDVVSDAVRNQDIQTRNVETIEKTAEQYIYLASESSGEDRHQYLIKAAELLYKRGDISLAQDQLQNIKPENMEAVRQIQIQLLAARIARANGNPEQAIGLLPENHKLNTQQLLEAGEIRAEASLDLGYIMDAIKSRVNIDKLYTKTEERELNHRAIWTSLSKLPSIVLKDAKSSDPVIQGWLELTRIMRKAQTDSRNLQNNILDWGTRFTRHPISNKFTNLLLDEHLNQYQSATRIAVLLPMQGRFQGVGNAIKTGFLSAYYEDNKAGEKPSIKFYDTSDENLDFMKLYQQVILEGANYIVGPFNKSIINRLNQTIEPDIPVLTLNYSENPLNTTENVYQFGLLPEDEAIQVAEQAIRQNKTNAAVLVPNSDWGRRLQTAFQRRYEELGGAVHTTQFYDARADDYAQPIKRLFNLHASNARHRDLQRTLGTELKFIPYRRQDIDMIFLAATHRSARGIMPAFKFHHASDLPVFSTSHVYTGNIDKKSDADLNGLMFCDLPWILIKDSQLRKVFDEQWPEQQNYTRLFALGIDAYHIIRNINYLNNHDYARFSGQTGNIYLDENNRLHRELLWARFKRGQARYINTTIAPEKTSTDGKNKS